MSNFLIKALEVLGIYYTPPDVVELIRARQAEREEKIGVIIGNPPWASRRAHARHAHPPQRRQRGRRGA
jgi:hypothetical protein